MLRAIDSCVLSRRLPSGACAAFTSTSRVGEAFAGDKVPSCFVGDAPRELKSTVDAAIELGIEPISGVRGRRKSGAESEGDGPRLVS